MAEAEANAKYEIVYFGAAGRAEVMKLCASIGKIEFKETVIGREWGEKKASTPWGSLPYVVNTDGKMMGQSRALTRYFAKKANLYPTNAKQAAQVDAIYDFCEDITAFIIKQGKAEDVRKGHWAEGGGLVTKLAALDKYIKDLPGDIYAVGNSLSMADLTVFCWMNSLVSGFWDHFPGPDALQKFPNIQRVRRNVLQVSAVKARYDSDFPAKERFEGFIKAMNNLGEAPEGGLLEGEPTIGEWDEDKSTTKSITYFDAPGRAELARAMLTMKGMEFENKCLGKEDWKQLKSSGTIPLGNQVPILTTSDGVTLTQSLALARYVAKQCGFYPESAEDAQLSDAIVEACADMGNTNYGLDEEKRKEAWNGGKLSMLAEKMEACLPESKYSCGDEITWADFSIWATMASMGKIGSKTVNEKCKKIASIRKLVSDNANIKKSLEANKAKPGYASFYANA